MKLPEAMRVAVSTDNPGMAGEIADILRFRCSMDYAATFQAFHKATGISEADFDELMYRADSV